MSIFPPVTPIIPSNPKIKICMSGLALMVMDSTARAEIGYLKHHVTNILIWKTRDHIRFDRVIMPNPTGINDTLEIISPKDAGNIVGRCECYNGSDKDKHYENMLDLSEPDFYGSNAELKSDILRTEFPLKISIDDCVFFTDSDTHRTVERFVESGTSKPPASFTVATGLWGHSKNPDAYIKFNGQDLRPQPDETYIIRLSSICNGVGGGDFKHYFDFLQNVGDSRLNLRRLGGKPLWFIDPELYMLKDLLDEATNFLKIQAADPADAEIADLAKLKILDLEKLETADSLKSKLIERLIAILLEKLGMNASLFCSPEPCLFSTFTNKARSLPMNNLPII